MNSSFIKSVMELSFCASGIIMKTIWLATTVVNLSPSIKHFEHCRIAMDFMKLLPINLKIIHMVLTLIKGIQRCTYGFHIMTFIIKHWGWGYFQSIEIWTMNETLEKIISIHNLTRNLTI